MAGSSCHVTRGSGAGTVLDGATRDDQSACWPLPRLVELRTKRRVSRFLVGLGVIGFGAVGLAAAHRAPIVVVAAVVAGVAVTIAATASRAT